MTITTIAKFLSLENCYNTKIRVHVHVGGVRKNFSHENFRLYGIKFCAEVLLELNNSMVWFAFI